MELEGRKGLVDMGGSSRAWSVPTVSLHLAVLNVFQGFFGPKMAVFGPELQFLKLRSATCESRSRPPPLSFLLKLCVIVLHTHRYHPPKFHVNLKHHDGVLIFSHFARAACLLAQGYAPASARRWLPARRLELWELWGIMGNYGELRWNLGGIMGNYGELWGIMVE